MPDRLFSTPCHLHITPLHLTYTLDMAIGQYADLYPPVPHKHPTALHVPKIVKKQNFLDTIRTSAIFRQTAQSVFSAALFFPQHKAEFLFFLLCHDCSANGSSCEKAKKHH